MKTSSAFSFAQADIDHVLRLGGNTYRQRERIVAAFEEQKSTTEIADTLKTLYHGGNGIGSITAWYAEDGIHLSHGKTARYDKSAQVISWESAAERIGQLLQDGQFATNVELAEAAGYERSLLAEKFWNLYHDFSEEAREAGYLPILSNNPGRGFPEESAWLTEQLKSPEFRQNLAEEYAAFWTAYQQDRDLLRFHYHKPKEIWENLQDLSLPRTTFTSQLTEVPSVKQFISEDEIDAAMTRGSGFEGGKGRVFTFFQEPHTDKEKVDFLKHKYGIGGHSHALSGAMKSDESHDGKGLHYKKDGCPDVHFTWEKVAKRITDLIQKGRYLTEQEQAEYDKIQAEKALAEEDALQAQQPDPAVWEYNGVKERHPDDIILYQMGDFFELYGEDAKTAAAELDLNLTTRAIPGGGRVEMCGFPANRLEQVVEQLRDKHDVTISAVPKGGRERQEYSMPSIDHEAEQHINAQEAEFGADGTRVFQETEAAAAPTIRELHEQYKPIVLAAVMEDVPYRNACGHSDHENAVIEGNAAIRRAVLGSANMELLRLYSDTPEFRQRLHREIIDETYPKLHELLHPLTDNDIDKAIQDWNGKIESKHAVVRYMEKHGREKDTAAWLAHEFDGGDGKTPFSVRPESPEGTVLPWPKVQRRIAQLIKEDRFYTEAEQDRFDNIDPIAIREALAERGIVNGELVDEEKLDNDPFIQRVMADVEAISRESVPADEPEQPSPHNSRVLVSDEEYAAARGTLRERTSYDPAVPPYNVGDIVYLDDRPHQITELRDDTVQLLPTGMSYPIYRAESRERFEQLLREDNRNDFYTEFLPANLDTVDQDLRDVLAHGLIGEADKAELSELLRNGKSNQEVALWLSRAYPNIVETMELETGETADYRTMPEGIELEVLDADEKRLAMLFFQWSEVAPLLRGMYARQLDGFEQERPEPAAETPAFQAETVAVYPKADITVAGFETTDRRDFYDLAVGNVPFGQYQVRDKAYDKLNFSIHNYFFAKALDQVRPGGVVAFVTSRYTMDAKDSTVRRYLAQRAELLGAIRLPNDAFKKNAGAEVVSDIIFLQKRDRPLDIVPEWTQTGQTEDGFAINRYFLDHPEMVLGRQEPESTAHGMDYTVNPIEGLELADQLHDAVKYIRGTYQEAELPELGEGEAIDTSIPADPNVKNYSYTVVDGDVYYRENSCMVRPDLNATAEARVKGLVGLRECVQQLIDLQMDAATPDSAIQDKQAELNRLYDSFSAKYGLINDRANRLAFADDSSYYLLCALEVIDEDGKLERKADMFTKRTIKPHKAVDTVDTASEALAVSISEKAFVDMAYMAELTGKTGDELAAELKGVIFRVPGQLEKDGTPHYVTADEYLSGNVRRKLRQAQRAAQQDPSFAVNVEALTAAQPKDLDASEIEVRLGATWIDKEYIQQFMYETFDTPFYLQRNIEVNYSSFTAEWQITGKSTISHNDVAAYTTYGTSRANAYKILEDSLNLRDVRIYDTIEDADGKERRVLNAKETTLAAQKQQAIRDAFKDWIWKDPDRRQALVRQYNEEMNSTRPREYDGGHITFGGMNPAITLREHQKNAIAHVLYGGNTLLAHEVGAGKTFEMVAAAMESKRLGLCQKSLFVVPNHLTEQWASEFLRLYPSANILVTTKKDFETHNRKKFCARIATGDYDAIIMGHSQFEKIPISRERQERLLQEQIDEITEGIAEVKYSGGERFTVKQLERTKKSLEARLEKLQAESRKDDVVTFEQLGVDRLFVDEAHN